MLMVASFPTDDRDQNGRWPLRPCPADFEATFIAIGRLACEEHYGTRRKTVDRWLEECGKPRLIAARADYARNQPGFRVRRKCPPDFERVYVALGHKDSMKHYGAGPTTIKRWISECGGSNLVDQRRANSLSVSDMSTILKMAFPRKGRVSFTLARHAAQHLRIRRNGGFTVSPAPNGFWWIGTKKITAAELVEMAVKKGFDPGGHSA